MLLSAAPLPADLAPVLIENPVSAGFPLPAGDQSHRRIDLNTHLFIHPETSFLFRVQGNSMTDAGIFDGDTIIVDRAIEAQHGYIVLAIVDDAFTVKRLYHKNGHVRLMPENPDYAPIDFSGEQELRIWGVVTTSIRKLF